MLEIMIACYDKMSLLEYHHANIIEGGILNYVVHTSIPKRFEKTKKV